MRRSSSSLFSGDDIAEDIADVDDASDDGSDDDIDDASDDDIDDASDDDIGDASDDDIDSLCTSDHNLASFDDGDECEVHQVSSFS